MKIQIANDLHVRGPLQLMTTGELIDTITRAGVQGIPTVLLGDVIDLKNCKKSEVGLAKDDIEFLDYVVKRYNGIYVGGNHELNYDKLPMAYIINDTFFSHGHLLMNYDKYSKWNLEEKKAGAGWLKRHIITPAVDGLRRFKEVRPNKELLTRLQYTKYKRIFLAHSHPDQDVDFEINGCHATILSRGVHMVDIV